MLSEVFECGRDTGLTEYNPCLGAGRNPERPRKRFVTWQEYAQVRRVAQPVIRLAMLLTRLTGMREGDLLKLRWSDVSDRGVRVIHGKTGFDQGLRLSWGLSTALKAARGLWRSAARRKSRENIRSLYVLHNRAKQPYTTSGFQSLWQRTVKKSGVPDIHFHDLRARAITDAENRRSDGADLAGHTDPRTTRRIYRRGSVRVSPVR
jgi:integrase